MSHPLIFLSMPTRWLEFLLVYDSGRAKIELQSSSYNYLCSRSPVKVWLAGPPCHISEVLRMTQNTIFGSYRSMPDHCFNAFRTWVEGCFLGNFVRTTNRLKPQDPNRTFLRVNVASRSSICLFYAKFGSVILLCV